MKAREFLARKKQTVEERNLIKEPLTAAELRALSKKAGGAEQLVAPKRRKEAEGLSGEKLIAWLAGEGGRVRRPIIEVDGELTLGFAADAQEKLERLLPRRGAAGAAALTPIVRLRLRRDDGRSHGEDRR